MMNTQFGIARAFAERYNLVHEPDVQEILEALLELDEEEDRNDLLELLYENHKEDALNPNPFLPHPPADIINGEIPIGFTETGVEVGVNLSEAGRGGFLLGGQTGSGKTNTIENFILNCLDKRPDDVVFWIFETAKRSYRHVMPDSTLIIPCKQDRFNCWREPPGLDYRNWEMGMIEVLSQYAGLKEAGMNMLFECVQEANEIYGTYKGSNVRPTMVEIYNLMLLKRERYLKKHDYSRVGYIDRWSNKLFVFTTALRDIVSVDIGLPLERLINRHCIWELTGLSLSLQSWFINAKLLWKMEYKKANPGAVGKLNINVFDEGGRVLGRNLFEDNK